MAALHLPKGHIMNPRWSPIELKRLRAYAKRGLTARIAAEKLGRPYIATRVKASQSVPPIRFNGTK
jgi:hypothetical protein